MAFSRIREPVPVADRSGAARGLFVPGHNCWRAVHADRAAVLIDGDAYFRAFMQAALRAQRSIFVLAWDFNSHTRLHGEADSGVPSLLGDFLNHMVRHRRSLEVRVLIWDYPMIFGADREFPPIYGLGWRPHRRIRVCYDNTHPFTGSHHQKVIDVDDSVAFCGGLDLTCRRWDTCAHRPNDARRREGDAAYPPFHDVMMMVDGVAARSLASLARERWQRATGRCIPVTSMRSDPWPADFAPDFADVRLAISRTLPATEERSQVREVEQLYLDMIAGARRTIFIENQYFTAHRIGQALEARLAEPDGPEIIVVLRLLSHGWLEELTMENLRRRLIDRLRAADRHGRFHAYYPYIEGLAEGTCIDVHSKVMSVDDEWLRIGSANLSNRSMGFDSECDLTIEAQGRADVSAGIRHTREKLLAEHLGVTQERLAAELQGNLSIATTIERLRNEKRTLEPLHDEREPPGAVMNIASLADPEQPVTLDNLIAQFAPRTEASRRLGLWAKAAAILLLVGALAALWRFTPLAEVFTAERVTGWARDFAQVRWAPLIVLGAFTIASIVMFPRPLITLFAVVAFGPWLGFTYSMAGVLIAALLSYVAGMRFDRNTVRRLGGPKLNRMIQVLRERGFAAVTALRLVPLAPFAVEGLVAGAIRISLWDFMLGTALGMLPGLLAATVFGDQLAAALTGTGRINFWLIGGIAAGLAMGAVLVRRWLLTTQIHGEAASTR